MPYGTQPMGLGEQQETPAQDPSGGMEQIFGNNPAWDFSDTSQADSPLSGLSDGQVNADAEYHALHMEEAAHKLKELDGASKFRRAIGLLTTMYATLDGRPDIAAMEQKKMQDEDQARAMQQQNLILSHVGMRSLEREKSQRDMNMLKLTAAQEKAKTQVAARASENARKMARGMGQNAEGGTVDVSELAQALAASYTGDSGHLSQILMDFPYDPIKAAAQEKAATTIAGNTGAAGAAKINVGSAIARAGAQARSDVVNNPTNVQTVIDNKNKETSGTAQAEADAAALKEKGKKEADSASVALSNYKRLANDDKSTPHRLLAEIKAIGGHRENLSHGDVQYLLAERARLEEEIAAAKISKATGRRAR